MCSGNDNKPFANLSNGNNENYGHLAMVREDIILFVCLTCCFCADWFGGWRHRVRAEERRAQTIIPQGRTLPATFCRDSELFHFGLFPY